MLKPNRGVAISMLSVTLLCCGSAMRAAEPRGLTPQQPGLVRQEFLFEESPFASCHASTLAETPAGLVAAWFGGVREGDPSVGIWLSRQQDGGWSAPVEVAHGIETEDSRFPCWNPVLFQPQRGPLLLFYKIGPSPRNWWGMLMYSTDDGKTWSKPQRLPKGILGPIKNKPIQLANGTILCGSSTEDAGWRVHMEWTADLGRTWGHTEALNENKQFSAIQPTILKHGAKLQILCRTRDQHISEAWSNDGGQTWSPMASTALLNPNSGFDGVSLADGRALLVYNHSVRNRSPLNVVLSEDGKRWQSAAVLERDPGEFSYPAVIQTSDGLVHTTYTWNRQRIKHVVLDPRNLELKEIPEGR
jgi:predicted neuraminidase